MKYKILKRVFTNTLGKQSYSVLCLESGNYYQLNNPDLLNKLIGRKKTIIVNVAKKSDL